MAKHEDGDGFGRRGRGPSGGRDEEPARDDAWGDERVAPGKRTVSQDVPVASATAVRGARLRLARGQLAAIQDRYLPRLRTAVDGRQMHEARTSAIDLHAALGTVDRSLTAAREHAMLRGDDGDEIAALSASLDQVRRDAGPALALAPPTPPALPSSSPFAMHLDPSAPPGYDETEQASLTEWSKQLDAHDAGAQAIGVGNLIDASQRFGRHAAPGSAQVQRKSSSNPTSGSDVQRIADEGVSGSSGSLPHGDAIQRAFGKHDISGISAHVDGAAAAASKAIGAEAYATGDRVAFAHAPTLHTAAHEAAHVVQQRGGVQLADGVGQVGDPYEQHADQVADAVVAGASAEALLDGIAGSVGSTSVQRKDATEAAEDDQRISYAYSMRYNVNDRVSLEGQLNWRGNDPVYKAGRVKGLEPEVKLQARSNGIELRLSSKLASVNVFDGELIEGLHVSVDTEALNFDATLASMGNDPLRTKGPAMPTEISIAAMTVKLTGDLTKWLVSQGVELGPYTVSIEARVKVRLDPADIAHAARALKRLRDLRRLEKQAEEATDVARSLKVAAAELEGKVARYARNPRKARQLATAQRRLARVVARQGVIRKGLKRILDLVKVAHEALAGAVGKLTSKSGQVWGRLLATYAGRIVAHVVGIIGGIMVVLDITEIAAALYHFIRNATSFKFGGGGEVGVEGGEQARATGDEPDGTVEIGSEDGVYGGEGQPGTVAGSGPEPYGPHQQGVTPDDGDSENVDELSTAGGGDGVGAGDHRDGENESGRVVAPGTAEQTRAADGEEPVVSVDDPEAVRGDSASGERVVVGDGDRAHRVLDALASQGFVVSDNVRGYIEVLVPDEWTEAQIEELVGKLVIWLVDPLRRGARDADPDDDDGQDDEELITMLVDEIAVSTERADEAAKVARPPGTATAAGGQGKGDGGGSKTASAGRGRGKKSGKAGGKGGHHGGRSAAGKKTARGRRGKVDEPRIIEGRLELGAELVEQWISIEDDQPTTSKAARSWLARNKGKFKTTIEGVTYRATNLMVLGRQVAPGEYETQVLLEMASAKGESKLFTFDFTYVPGADKDKRFMQADQVSIEPLENVAYLDAGGRPTIDLDTKVDLGPFAVIVRQAVSMETTKDPSGTHELTLGLLIYRVDDAGLARWRGQTIEVGAFIEGAFSLRLLRGAPPP